MDGCIAPRTPQFKAAISRWPTIHAWAAALLLASTGCAAIDPDAPGVGEAASSVDVAKQGQALTNAEGQCSDEQWTKILQANAGANWLIERALEDFDTPENLELRRLWFGARIDRDIIYKLLDLAEAVRSSVQIRCDPPDSANCLAVEGAYGYHTDQTIALCAPYWELDHNQGDYDFSVSQVGGLLHELTHLTLSQGGTTDFYGYGYVNARNVALGGNNQAVLNADNWRHYLMQVPISEYGEQFVTQP